MPLRGSVAARPSTVEDISPGQLVRQIGDIVNGPAHRDCSLSMDLVPCTLPYSHLAGWHLAGRPLAPAVQDELLRGYYRCLPDANRIIAGSPPLLDTVEAIITSAGYPEPRSEWTKAAAEAAGITLEELARRTAGDVAGVALPKTKTPADERACAQLGEHWCGLTLSQLQECSKRGARGDASGTVPLGVFLVAAPVEKHHAVRRALQMGLVNELVISEDIMLQLDSTWERKPLDLCRGPRADTAKTRSAGRLDSRAPRP